MARVFVEPTNVVYNDNKGKFFKECRDETAGLKCVDKIKGTAGNEIKDIKELKKVVKKLMKMNFKLMNMIQKDD
tara:strand:- start:429 stop:650 length:222 start_codon:yes stop_codon:yes gene_type:complete